LSIGTFSVALAGDNTGSDDRGSGAGRTGNASEGRTNEEGRAVVAVVAASFARRRRLMSVFLAQAGETSLAPEQTIENPHLNSPGPSWLSHHGTLLHYARFQRWRGSVQALDGGRAEHSVLLLAIFFLVRQLNVQRSRTNGDAGYSGHASYDRRGTGASN
jgi:hypothetical protein